MENPEILLFELDSLRMENRILRAEIAKMIAPEHLAAQILRLERENTALRTALKASRRTVIKRHTKKDVHKCL